MSTFLSDLIMFVKTCCVQSHKGVSGPTTLHIMVSRGEGCGSLFSLLHTVNSHLQLVRTEIRSGLGSGQWAVGWHPLVYSLAEYY